MRTSLIAIALVTTACTATSPGEAEAGSSSDGAPISDHREVALADAPFTVEAMGEFDEPWAADFMPGSSLLFITGKQGKMWFKDVDTGRLGTVTGVPDVDYGGQGGFGDIEFSPTYSVENPGNVYLSWVEAGEDDTRGAVVGRAQLICEEADACRLDGLTVLWRQDKTGGRGHYSHRIHVSPDGQYLFVTSGDRQQQDPAQDTSNNLGAVLRLNLDGSAAEGNPMFDAGGSTAEIWSYGHRNLLGLDFAPDGKLWEIEMGPKHGDELNLVEAGVNYGWPEASYGNNYNGTPIPPHKEGDGYRGPVAYWDPATSPGSLLIYSGDLFADWAGDALIPGLSGQELNVVSIDGDRATDVTSYAMGARIREVVQGPDGTVYVIEDDRGDSQGRLLKLTPKGE